MGKDNQPKVRQLKDLQRKQNQRASYDRILIVSEGKKTEPNYFGEIRSTHKLQTANVQIQPGELGTAPIQVVQYACDLFKHGSTHRGVRAQAFEQVYAVFDRDDHPTYWDALKLSEELNGSLRNDAKKPVQFKAVASVPCFELWLLLHYEDIQHPIHRDEVVDRLKKHIPDYEKGKQDIFSRTQEKLGIASDRARKLAERTSSADGKESFTDIHLVVAVLKALKG